MTKQPGKPTKKAKSNKPSQPPARFGTESVMRDVQRALEGKNFGSIEDVNAYLETLAGPGLKQSLRDAAPLSPKEDAQELAFDAMGAETEEQARKLAGRALALDPDCVDALVTMASLDARSAKEAIAALEKAVEAGERSLGAKFFQENSGHFWGILETRPYMRARAQLASLHRSEGHVRKAIEHYEALLNLNPNDNQGVRDELLGCYLECGDLDAAGRLLKQYANDGMANFAWGRVLERFLSSDLAGARRALQKARKGNRFVELYLSLSKRLPEEMPEMYGPGSEEEAVLCVENLMGAWAKHQDALFWLLGRLQGSAPLRKSGESLD